MRIRVPILLLALALSGCATPTVEGALATFGISHAAYCALTPGARAELRRRLDIRVQVVDCISGEGVSTRRAQGAPVRE